MVKKKVGPFQFQKHKAQTYPKLFSESPENDFFDPVIGQKLACEESKCDLELFFNFHFSILAKNTVEKKPSELKNNTWTITK